MELKAAEALANEMMRAHQLDLKGWSFQFDRARKRLGATKYGPKLITLSPFMTEHASEEQVRQVMLHEIAHALLPPGAGHGKEWKAKAASLGYVGGRLAVNPYQEALRRGLEEETPRHHAKALQPVKRRSRVRQITPPVRFRVGWKVILPNSEEIVLTEVHANMVKGVNSQTKREWSIPEGMFHLLERK